MTISKKTKKAGALTGILVIIIVIFGTFLPGLLEPVAGVSFPDEHLFVDETILLKTNETNDTVSVTCILFLTNIWSKESDDLKAIAYVVETENNFAVSETEVDIGKVESDSTIKVDIPVVFSNNSYKVKVLLFEKGKLVIKGELIIRAYPIYSWEEIKREKIQQEWHLFNDYTEFAQIR